MKAVPEVTVVTILITLLLVGLCSCLSELINISNDTDIEKSTEQNNGMENNVCEAANRRRHVQKDDEDIDNDEAEEAENDEDDANLNSPEIGIKAADERSVHRQVKRKGKQPKVWDQWGKWSCCSTSCGPGKLTRWRHCISGGCASGEKEAQIKSCHLKSC